MASLASFRAQFPEFNNNTDTLITAFLNAAALELDHNVWGQFSLTTTLTKADQGHMYLAAHKLAISPFGQSAKTLYTNKKGYERTTYGAEFLLMMRSVTSGFRVA